MSLDSEEKLPPVSVVIPIRNEADYIWNTLKHVCAQDYPADKHEILLADGMSTDGTRDIIQDFIEQHSGPGAPEIKVIDNEGLIVPTGFNSAVQASNADIVLIMGAHSEYKRNYIRESVNVLLESGADIVGGPTLAIGNGYVSQAIAAAYNSPFSAGGARLRDLQYEGEVDTVTFGCWHREFLLSMGGYDEELVRNQDDELNLRTVLSGGKIYQSPRIASRYYTRNSIGKLFRQQYQYGYWKVRVIQKHKRPASIRHLIPGLFVAGLVVGFVLSFIHQIFLWIYLAAIILYGGASVAFSMQVAMKKGLSLLPVMPLVFLTYHVGYGLGFLVGVMDFVVTRRKFRKLFGSSSVSLNR